ncbi:MAG: bifunctional diguanylate cyclase/phosphohydrolase [Solirubrobacterales bacterium]
MGLSAFSGSYPASEDNLRRSRDRRLRAREPRELISGQAAATPVAKAQGWLGIGGGVIGATAALLPHPSEFNVYGLLTVDIIAITLGAAWLACAGRLSIRLLRVSPASATLLTTAAVISSGYSTSAFVMFYLWVGLYAFYFPTSKREAALHVLFAAANYTFAIAVMPSAQPVGDNSVYSFFVIAAGTLVTAGILLTYLRGRVERLLGRLTDAARTDPLTGLPNRAGLLQAVEVELERVRASERPVSLLVVDVDRYSEIHRHYGAEAADSVLQRLGSLLDEWTRLIDTASRAGGQEFAILLPETSKHEAFLAAEELLVKLREVFKPPFVEMTASIGVASFPDDGGQPDDLFRAATDAVQAAKLLGRDRAVVYSKEVTGSLSAAARVAAGQSSVERQASLASVLSLAAVLDLRDSDTARHSQIVGELCELTARELRMEEDKVQRLRIAGLLHDIGKVGVADEVLRKPGPLNEEEWVQMRRHPELGASILSGAEMEDLREWVLAHHERPDGRGYPRGLRAGEISVEAAIIAACDAYEAMTCDRRYRPAIGEEAAQKELLHGADTQFDPAVVEALVSAVTKAGAATRF